MTMTFENEKQMKNLCGFLYYYKSNFEAFHQS